MLERHALRLRNEENEKHDEQDIHRPVKQEGVSGAEAVDQCEKGHSHNRIRDPVCAGAAGDAEVSAGERKDFRANDPNDRTGAHREADDKEQESSGGPVA